MKYVKRFIKFWYHFIVGDDWRIAVGVILSIGITALAAHSLSTQVWWLLPLLVVTMLSISLWLDTK